MSANPEMGEIDIIKGINQQSVNTMALYTSAGCVVENATIFPGIQGNTNGQLEFSGQMTTINCNVNAAGQGQNVGRSIQAPINPLSTSVASAGNLPGGCLAHLRYEIQPRGRRNLCYGVDNRVNQYLVLPPYQSHTQRRHKQYSQPQWLGYPLAKFAGSDCDFQARFKDLKIVIDTTFCGAWAGKVWQSGGCAASTGSAICEAYVRDNPAAFSEAYWEIVGLKRFQNPTANVKRDSNHAHRMPHQKGRLYRWWL
jgi:hypothetical protein